MRRCYSIPGFLLGVVVSLHAEKIPFAVERSLGNVETVTLTVPEKVAEKVKGDWLERFSSKRHAIHSYDSHKDPRGALSVIDEAFCFVMQFLPAALVTKKGLGVCLQWG